MNVRFSPLHALAAVLVVFVLSPATAFAQTNRVLYVADSVHNAVYAFDAQNFNAPLLGEITDGVATPSSIAVDSRGELYVANTATNDVTVYKHGAASPYRRIAASKLGIPSALAIESDDGLVVGYDGNSGRNATLALFSPGAARPARLISIPLGNNAAITIGAIAIEAGAVYASVMRSPNGPSQILRFAPGSSRGIDIGIAPGTGESFDAFGNLYVDGGASVTAYAPDRRERYAINGVVNGGQLAVERGGTLFVPNGQRRICSQFTEPGYVTEYAPGSQNASSYLMSSYLQNPVSLALYPAR